MSIFVQKLGTSWAVSVFNLKEKHGFRKYYGFFLLSGFDCYGFEVFSVNISGLAGNKAATAAGACRLQLPTFSRTGKPANRLLPVIIFCLG